MLPRRSLPVLALPFLALPAAAQTWPDRPIRIIVPFAAGGSGDITARLVGAHIEAATHQPVIIDNRAGANGIIGTMAVKQAAPDGHTLLLATTTTHSANPSLVRNLPYDPARDFIVVGTFGNGGSYFVVRPDGPHRDMAGLIAAARARPGALFFGHFNASSRLPSELLNVMAGVRITGVPYRAIGTAFTDLLAGRIDVIAVDAAAAEAYLRNGQVRAIALTRARRIERFPDLPVMAEFFPDFVTSGFLGLAAPSAIPRAVAERLNMLVNEAITRDPMRARLLEFGFSPEALDLDATATLIRTERERWARFVAMAGIEPE